MPRALNQIRWTIADAASEFGMDRQTLSKRIKSKGVTPGGDKKFSTTDICRAIFTSDKQARTELYVSQKEGHDLKNKKLAGTLADKELFQAISDSVVLILRQKVTDSSLPESQKIEFLKDIQKINIDELVAANSQTDASDLDEEPEAG